MRMCTRYQFTHLVNKGKSQDTFETLGDVEAEGKRDTLGNVEAEPQSNQKCKPKHLQRP